MDKKVCSICKIKKELSEYYSQNKKRKDGTEYIYYPPSCKECTSKKSHQWRLGHEDQFRASQNKYRKTPKYRARVKAMNGKLKGYNKQWQKDNAEHLNKCTRERKLHKEHTMTNSELDNLYEYCDNRCMYCGMTEDEHKDIYKQRLHRDHAINEGSNGIDNCVIACKGCNVSKWNRDWDEWYTPDNPKYTFERFLKIKHWLESFEIN